MATTSILTEEFTLGGRGLRVAVKDSIDIAGYPTRGGSAALANVAPAARHADVVEALIAAGCTIVGKANMHEIAYGVTGINAWTGTPENPRFPGRIPGGSSSGSAAAVAAGLCDFALGSDTGGSIRMPAACCGVYGLKPSFGRVSRVGAQPAQTSLDCIGPLAGSIAMIEQAMAIIDPTFHAVDEPAAPRLGQVACSVSVEVATAFETALGAMAMPLDPISLQFMEAAFTANMLVIGAETHAAFGHLLGVDGLGEDVRTRLEKAGGITSAQLCEAERVRLAFRAEVDAALARVDALILPALPAFPPTIAQAGEAAAALALTALVRQFNLSGHPALTIPVIAPQGLPIGIQIVGRRGEDEALCALGRMIEAALETMHSLQVKEPAR